MAETNTKRKLAHLTLLVADYDEAIRFYVDKLNFELVEDTTLSDTKRWVLVRPGGDETSCLLLAKAANDQQLSQVGCQAGGRVFLFLHTSSFWEDYHRLKKNGVSFVREPSEETYGTVAVFEDLYGNLIDLVEPAGGL